MNQLGTVLQHQQSHPLPAISTDLFVQVLIDLSKAKDDAQAMLLVLDRFFSKYQLRPDDFPFQKKSYTRSIMIKEDSGFEIALVRWDKGARTPIHGHPGFSFTYVIEGHLQEKLFVREGDHLLAVDTTHYSAGDYAYQHEHNQRFDNAIHQMTAGDKCLSLHIYSDDAMRGEVFQRRQ